MRKLLALVATIGGLAMATGASQFMVASFLGSDPGAALDLIHTYHPAGLILYPSNLSSHPKRLVRTLREADPNLLIMIDQEGGPFHSYRNLGVVRFPSLQTLGAANSTELAFQTGKGIGEEVCSLGASIDLAPVLDVNINPKNPIIGIRSFGANPRQVAKMGIAFFRGLEAGGVIPTGKHFPGHGDTSQDSHLALPVVDKSLSELERVELLPFREAIQAGLPIIMTAHILFPKLDPNNPATLSYTILTGLLRDKLGFGGLIVTDDMAMKAIKDHYGAGEAALRAVKAGADLVLLSTDPKATAEVYQTLNRAVESGTISKTRYLETSRRLAKIRTGLHPPCNTPNYHKLETLALKVARKGLTWLFGPLPIPGLGTLVVAPKISKRYGEEPSLSTLAPHYLPGSRGYEVSQTPSQAQLKHAVSLAKSAERIVLGTYHWLGRLPSEQLSLYHALLALGKPLYVVALGDPNDLIYLNPAPSGYLVTYGYRSVQIIAALQALAGDFKPSGRLPVPIGSYPIGFGKVGKP